MAWASVFGATQVTPGRLSISHSWFSERRMFYCLPSHVWRPARSLGRNWRLGDEPGCGDLRCCCFFGVCLEPCILNGFDNLIWFDFDLKIVLHAIATSLQILIHIERLRSFQSCSLQSCDVAPRAPGRSCLVRLMLLVQMWLHFSKWVFHRPAHWKVPSGCCSTTDPYQHRVKSTLLPIAKPISARICWLDTWWPLLIFLLRGETLRLSFMQWNMQERSKHNFCKPCSL